MYRVQNNKTCNSRSGGVTKVLKSKNRKHIYDLLIISAAISLRIKNKKPIINNPCNKK